MPLNWIDVREYAFNSFLLLERFQLAMMLAYGSKREDKQEWQRAMGIALNANPAVAWYFKHRCPEHASFVDELVIAAPNSKDVRKAEIYVLASAEDFITYTTPEVMVEKCDFIRGWSKERLYELVDLNGKTVLDAGAGSGRLTFAAAEKAAWVYASEPVGTLREFIRNKTAKEGNKNIRVLDGLVPELPFPDNTFDVVMSGHVVGDFWDEEIAELSRVCKPNGWLVDCPGDSLDDRASEPELIKRGWEEIHYIGSFGKDVHCYRKCNVK